MRVRVRALQGDLALPSEEVFLGHIVHVHPQQLDLIARYAAAGHAALPRLPVRVGVVLLPVGLGERREVEAVLALVGVRVGGYGSGSGSGSGCGLWAAVRG